MIKSSRSNSQDDSISNIGGGSQKLQQQPLWIPTNHRRASLARASMQLKMLPAYLVIESENGSLQRFYISKMPFTIGRRDNRDIVLQCPLISKDHATVERDTEGYFIVDNNSSNGILVNDELVVVSRYLDDGDVIQIGSILLTFYDEMEINGENWRSLMESHPAFSQYIQDMKFDKNSAVAAMYGKTIAPAIDEVDDDSPPSDDVLVSEITSSLFSTDLRRDKPLPRPMPRSRHAQSALTSSERILSDIAGHSSLGRRPRSGTSQTHTYSTASSEDKHLSLVTILPSEEKYLESITVQAELSGISSDTDFLPVETLEANSTSNEELKQDYEKLRLAYELSKLGLTDISTLLEKMLDMMFSVLPVVDRGVVLLIDRKSGMLTTDKVKLREGKGVEHKEILLSSTILKRVCESKRCLITSDAFQDPFLKKAESIARGNIRTVICVPLVAHDQVHGVLHLDSQDRINAFIEKDLALVKAISNQAAIALENCKLLKDIEKEVTIRENLGRFLPPHVVDRVISKGEEPIKKGGRQTIGTILFADIRGFTQLSEKSSPQEVVDLLNDFFERLVRIVFKYDGVLDKYIGDCLMAAFGTLPSNKENSELAAIRAALEFKEAISEINMERTHVGKVPISIGVGLNTGQLVAGYIGSSQRLEYTCIGDSVNTASRICNMALENQVLISEHTYAIVKEHIQALYIGKKMFKGKSEEIEIYEVTKVLL